MNKNQNINDIVYRLEVAVGKIELSTQNHYHASRDFYRQELEHAVDVLKQTKSSFHSKQLKKLRERIEKVLHEYH